ncbi:MAG: aminotransferase class IV [Deltaproteobacteria bacterium]|nr:aminotransferase class IV [Deltaproteobacteria bacterium]
MKASRYIYLNGAVTPVSRARVSVEDRGFLYGDGVFETLKYSNGRAAFKDEHLARLLKNLSLIGIPAKGVKVLIKDIKGGVILRLLEKSGLKAGNAYVRITVTRGCDGAGLLPSPGGVSRTCVIVVKAIDENLIDRIQKNGVNAVTISGFARALPSIKSLNFLPNVLAKMEAQRRGAYEGIFTGKDGNITEGTSTNLFIVKNNSLLTPPAFCAIGKDGALPGVMRQAVIKKAKTLGIPFKEKCIGKKDLLSCDEAFLTNSMIEAAPLVCVDGRAINGKRIGSITRMILRSLRPPTRPAPLSTAKDAD